MLQVRDLAVEVGGRYTLTDASFSLHAGRQGRSGRPQRRGQDVAAEGARGRGAGRGTASWSARRRSATSRRTRRAAAPGSTAPRSSHVLSGRGLDAAARRLEELRAQVDADPSPRNVKRVRQRRGRVPRRGRLRGRVGGAADRRRARARRRPARPADQRAVGWRAPARRADAHPVRGQRPVAARRADEPPRRRRQGVAHVVPARATAARCSSSATTSRCSTRRSPACCISTRASSSSTAARTRSTSSSRKADEERRAKIAARQDVGDPAAAARSPTRCATRPRSGPAPPRRSTTASRSSTRNRIERGQGPSASCA